MALKDNNDNNDDNKQEIENDTATGFIVVVISIVSLILLLSVYVCVKEIKESEITDCAALAALLFFFIPFFVIIDDIKDIVCVKEEPLKKTLTFCLVILSIVSVFFLSNASGFTNELNGSIVIFCSIISLGCHVLDWNSLHDCKQIRHEEESK